MEKGQFNPCPPVSTILQILSSHSASVDATDKVFEENCCWLKDKGLIGYIYSPSQTAYIDLGNTKSKTLSHKTRMQNLNALKLSGDWTQETSS